MLGGDSNITDFLELSFEKRHNDRVNRLKYNRASNDEISKEYYSKTNKDSKSKRTEVGKSLGDNWDINIYEDDTSKNETKNYDEIDVGQMFSDFGIDAKPFISSSKSSSKSSSTKKSSAKKSPAKKSSAKKSSAKKSTKKGGRKKKSKKKK